jgi:hypothetical protein
MLASVNGDGSLLTMQVPMPSPSTSSDHAADVPNIQTVCLRLFTW